MPLLGLHLLHLLHLLVLWSPGGQGVLPARPPLIPQRPFLVVWNAPTESCRLRFKVDLDLSVFDIVANLNETLSGPNVTIWVAPLGWQAAPQLARQQGGE
ncbi:unnamed protein product [Merluccius merluccius]